MLKIGIWDDEMQQVALLKNIINEIAETSDSNVEITEATTDCDKIIQLIKEEQIDVLFLDISTKEDEKFGISFAKELRTLNPNFYLIFQTGNCSYTFDCFKCKTFDYILKPIDTIKIENVIKRIKHDIYMKNELTSKKKIIHFPNSLSMNYENIYYIEKTGHRDKIYTKDSFYLTYGSISDLLEKLPTTFVKCHRSFIVNTDKIISVDAKHNLIHLKDDLECPVSNLYIKYLPK